MPIYEYECPKCGAIEEVLQKFSDNPLKKCRHCSGKLTKLVSQSTFHLKGTGWYVTDYANKSKASDKPAKNSSDTKTKEAKSLKTKSKSTKASNKSD